MSSARFRGVLALVGLACALFGFHPVLGAGTAGTADQAGFQLASAAAAGEVWWAPAGSGAEALSPRPDLYYDGMAGRIVGATAETMAPIGAAQPLQLSPGEVLYVYLVEDGAKAAFDPPARVLLRERHEVVVATRGDVPTLTVAAVQSLSGLRQPVRVSPVPTFWPTAVAPAPEQPRTIDPIVQAIVAGITQANYMATWQVLDDFEDRYYTNAGNTAASQYIYDKLTSFGLSAQFHYFSQSGQRRNVIATLPGLVDPTKVVYICAHFDAISDTPDVCAPGADDNASGIAAVIEAARIMSQYQFQYTVKFAGFNCEEQGLIGSAAYVAQIASQGENVVGVYDADMIAYRGTDTGAADLVVYTNPASQPLANTLATCISDYVPGTLEPVIHVDTLEGSDYASFWHHGYPAICAIEDEAWGTDFCPWYHTCNDRIERYPTDYCVNCTKAIVAALSTIALPLNPTGPYLIVQSSQIDDDSNGGTIGNGDGVLNPGETVDLWVTIRNVGNAAAHNVTGVLSSQSADVTLLNPNAAWNDIPASGTGTNLTAFRFRLSVSVADGTPLAFTLTMHDDSGTRPLSLNYTVFAPSLAYYSHRLVDHTSGNGNGIIDPGEVVLLPVSLINRGGGLAAPVQAVMTSGSADLTIVDGQSGIGQIAPGAHAELAPAFRVGIASGAPVGEVLTVNLAITAGAGYTATSTFKVKVGTSFYDEAEENGAWTLGAADDNATTGMWVRDDPIGTLQNGQQAQSEDDHTAAPGTDCYFTGQGTPGGLAGDSDVDGGKTTLTTPTFDLTRHVQPTLTYWRWFTNNLGNNPNADPWVVQVSSNAGTSWVDLENTTNSANSWTQKTFDLATYITPTAQVAFRFVARDDSPGSLIEAAVDDIEIGGTVLPVDAPEPATAYALALEAPRPSVVRDQTTISFTAPAGLASLRIYSVDGRLVRTLVNATLSAGRHRAVWDGRNGAGNAVAPGLYFCRLHADGRDLNQRVLVVK